MTFNSTSQHTGKNRSDTELCVQMQAIFMQVQKRMFRLMHPTKMGYSIKDEHQDNGEAFQVRK